MANGRLWFKDYQGDFLGGTNGMPPEQFAVYVRVIWMMYEADGPVVRNDKYMAGVCGLGIRAFRKALQELLHLQKLCYSEETLQLTNFRAENEIVKRRKIHDVRAIAQTASVASKKLKVNKNNKNWIANDLHNGSQTSAQKLRKTPHILEAREEESPSRDLSSSSNEDSERESAASLARLKSLASPRPDEPEDEEAPEEEVRDLPEQHDEHCFARHAFLSEQEWKIRQAEKIEAEKIAAAEVIARKERLAEHKSERRRDQFLTTFPIDGRSSREVCGEIFNSLTNIEKHLAIDKIRDLLDWINEAPTDPERAVPSAENWLKGKLWDRFCQKLH